MDKATTWTRCLTDSFTWQKLAETGEESEVLVYDDGLPMLQKTRSQGQMEESSKSTSSSKMFRSPLLFITRLTHFVHMEIDLSLGIEDWSLP